MHKKKKYLASIRSFSGLGSHFHAHDYLWEKISLSFDKIFVINDDNLKFFPSLTQNWIEKDYDFRESENEKNRISQLVNTALASDPSKYSASMTDIKSLISSITGDLITGVGGG